MLRTIIALLCFIPALAFAEESVRIHQSRASQKISPPESRFGSMDQIDDCRTNATSGYPQPSICRFTVQPGHRRALLSDIEAGMGFPRMPNGGWIMGYNFYYSTDGFADFSPLLTPFKYIRIVQQGPNLVLETAVIDGLPSDVPVYFRTSAVDARGNEFYFTSDFAIFAECGSLTPAPPFDGSRGGDYCPFATVPYSRR